MLASLRVRNLGAVDDVTIEFEPGLNVLTGETGAGKTLLIEALHLVLGGTDRHLPVRDPTASSAVEAVFVDDAGTETVLARELAPGGRLRARIDGATASAQMLADRATPLCELHGQHEHQILRDKGAARVLLDRTAAIDGGEVAQLRRRRAELIALRGRLGGTAEERRRSIDLVRHELAEIDDVAPAGPGELDALLEELTTVSGMLDAKGAVLRAAATLDADGDAASAASLLAAALTALPRAMASERAELDGLLSSTRDLAGRLVREVEALDDDPGRLEQLDARVARLQALVRKHGHTLADVLARRDQLAADLERLEADEARATQVGGELDRTEHDLEVAEGALRRQRTDAAAALAAAVAGRLGPLALPHAAFDVRVEGAAGELVTFLFSGTGAFEPAPLADAASGGELARVMLALTLATRAVASCVVFDEVDAGVGGETARSLAACLDETAHRAQVIVVTHLASVAAVATHHVVVERGTRAGDPARVGAVRDAARVAEVARMLAGNASDPTATAHAAALLDEASAARAH